MRKYNIPKEDRILLKRELGINLDSDLFPATSDYVFKHMMANESDKSNFALKSLINAILRQSNNTLVEKVQVKNPNVTVKNSKEKNHSSIYVLFLKTVAKQLLKCK
jgi:hypothetical protein